MRKDPKLLFAKHISAFMPSLGGRHAVFSSTFAAKDFIPVIPKPHGAAEGSSWRIVSRKRDTEIGLET